MPPGVKIVPGRQLHARHLLHLRQQRGRDVGIEALLSWRDRLRAVITTEVPFSESLKISSKALLIVSVMT